MVTTPQRDVRPKASVVRLTPEDAPDLARLERACFSHPWTEEQLAYGLRERVLHVFGLRETGGELVGYCSFYAVADEAEIVNIAVIPQLRRMGFGRTLLGAMLQNAAELCINRVFLEVRRSNVAAIGLYEAHGFARTGVRPRYYSDTNEDALVMTLEMPRALSGQGGRSARPPHGNHGRGDEKS